MLYGHVGQLEGSRGVLGLLLDPLALFARSIKNEHQFHRWGPSKPELFTSLITHICKHAYLERCFAQMLLDVDVRYAGQLPRRSRTPGTDAHGLFVSRLLAVAAWHDLHTD